MKKRLISMISALSLLFTASYGAEVEGVGKGYKGDIKVGVTYEGNEIKEVKVLEHQETNFTKRAMKEITKNIVATQNVDVDNVAGATYTSEGIKEAVKSAIATAGIVLNSKSAVKEEKVALTDTTTDVVVVGGGGAGLTAAISAKEKGVNVILVEKMAMLGGNTNYATAGINAANSKLQQKLGIEDSSELFYQDTLKGGKNKNNPELLKTMTDRSGDIITWLVDRGADLTEVTYTGGQSVKRIHRPTGGKAVGPMIVETLGNVAEKEGIDIRLESSVKEILKDGDKVVGVKVEHKGEVYTIHAKAVVMATGGFGANSKMVAKYKPELKDFGSTNSPAITGEGIAMVESVGGTLVDMTEIQTHPTVVHHNTAMITEAVRGEGAILVNRKGERFINELETRDVVSKAELAQDGKSAFLVFDESIREKLGAINNYIKKGYAISGNSLDELAEKIGVDKKNLNATMNKYNEYVKAGKDTEFNKNILPRELGKAPFYAIEVSPAVHHTMGGVSINSSAEVLTADGKVIKGLYAAGEITGGVHGANRIGGNAMTDITVFGNIAGNNAAEYSKNN
ncbi:MULTISPECIES: flavocytochrome c [unclassified Fusobacterium]|uniref:flavocytochrome c n=1 Tax=Fusobacterium sp. TaxID=68766 RepID=UPI0025C1C5DD|nr:flavocytochrome c [Fusobacterium sp.]